jgi:hypothetical protein
LILNFKLFIDSYLQAFLGSVAAKRLPEALGGWQHGRRDGQHEHPECRPCNPGEGDVSLHKIKKNSTLY